MIQRIQTIWLLGVAIISSLLIFVPVIGNYDLLLKAESGWVAVLSIIIIFLYKNRPLQIKLCYVILILLILPYITVFLYILQIWTSPFLGTIGKWKGAIVAVLVLPLIAGLFDILAIRAIKKDEKLVRSLDRLR
jgi:hypothetical protein